MVTLFALKTLIACFDANELESLAESIEHAGMLINCTTG